MISSASAPRVRITLDALNFIEWSSDQRREHAAKTPYLTELFKGKTPLDYRAPKILDYVELADGTVTTTRRFETQTDSSGVVTLTSAGIRAFELANRQFVDVCDKRRSVNSAVLLDMQNHISTPSILKIQSQVGLLYEDIETDLVLYYKAVVNAHSKSDPVSLMEVWVKLTRCKMNDDYYVYIHEISELKKQVELKFSKYLDPTGHVAAFLDTILSLQLALGVSKKPEYINVLELFRSNDFSSPVPAGSAPNFTRILDLFTNATVSASVLTQFDESPFTGNAAVSKKKGTSGLQGNSSETVGTQVKCITCGTRFGVVLNFKTRLPFDVCKACFKKKTADKKASDEKAKATAAAKTTSATTKTVATKQIIPTRSTLTAASSTAVATPTDSNDFINDYENYTSDDESL